MSKEAQRRLDEQMRLVDGIIADLRPVVAQLDRIAQRAFVEWTPFVAGEIYAAAKLLHDLIEKRSGY